MNIYVIWAVQAIVMGLFDNRRGPLNVLLNIAVWGASVVMTFIEMGWVWALVPIFAVPIVGGIFGGIFWGLVIKTSRNNN